MFNAYTPTRILFGGGVLKKLHEQKLPGKKALLVISNGQSVHKSGALDETQKQLREAGADFVLFAEVGANPLKAIVEKGAARARSEHCDFVVALGGGSVMDAAKVMAMLAPNGGDLWDYAGGSTGKRQTPKKPALPVIAITTTAGTGSEVDPWGVVTKPETHEKVGITGSFPVLAIVDPDLMKSVPPAFTAYQGFDALFHSVEGTICKFANLMSDMVATTAITYIGKYLPRAVKNGDDMEAREGMAFANTLSGLSMVLCSTTSQHSLEHALSAAHQDLPHGAGLIMVSRGYFPFFIKKHVVPDRFIKMAKALGKKDATKPEDFIEALDHLKAACGVDNLKMSDYGVTREELPEVAKNARATMGGLFASDRYQLTDADAAEILKAAYR